MAVQKVLIAIDGSDYSSKAFDYYMNTVHKPGDVIQFIHGVEIPQIQDWHMPGTVTKVLKEQEQKAHKLGAEFNEKLRSKGLECKDCLIEFTPNAGAYIVEMANLEGINMVVMGTRGHGTIARTILGSVSDYVLHHAHCTVLVYKH